MRHILISGIAALMVTLLSVNLAAAQSGSCENAATTTDQIICFGNLYDKADETLNEVYKALRETLDEPGKIILRDAQRAWITFRDTECAWQSDIFRGGSMARVLVISCNVSLTEERSATLFQNIIEGDVATALDAGEPDTTFWLDETLAGKFDCQNYQTARLGLHPGRDKETFEPNMSARLVIGQHTIDIPISDDGDGLCGSAPFMSVTNPTSSCPGIRVDDGLCDGFFFSWNKQLGTYQYDRN